MGGEGAHNKKDLRRALKRARQEIPGLERQAVDEKIIGNLEALAVYSQAELVFTYLSFGAEVDTHQLIRDAWDQGKTVLLPRIVVNKEGPQGQEAPLMEWCVTTSFDHLEENSFGIREPHPGLTMPFAEVAEVFGFPGASERDRPYSQTTDESPPAAIAIVPGLAFDEQGFRLGYGGGYYDRFLSEFPGTSLGLCRFEFLRQKLDFLESHDVPVDIIVTERGVVEAS